MDSQSMIERMLNSTQTDLLEYSFEEAGDEGYSNFVWILLWVISLLCFLCCPFCGTSSRRKLCMRRIRERRWIDEDEERDQEALRRQQARRQQLDDQQRRFQVTRTQEDEIREQFLNVITGSFTKTLQKRDIYESDHKLVRSSSFRSIGSERSLASGKSVNDLKSNDPPADIEIAKIEQGGKKNSGSDTDDEDELSLVEDFQQTNEVVRVPLPGQQADSETAPRFVANGCAICLSKFDEGDELTWSSNKDCSHVFHRDCVINWFLAVGRKAHKKRLRSNPNMDEFEALDCLCKFPMLCPCCRQTFCLNPDDNQEQIPQSENQLQTNTDENSNRIGDIEQGQHSSTQQESSLNENELQNNSQIQTSGQTENEEHNQPSQQS